MANKFNVGDIVIVADRAWSRVISTESFQRYLSTTGPDGNLRQFRVLAVNAKIPCWDACFANTLIQDIETAELIVINDCNLYSELVADIRFVVAGSDVTDKISKQSKQAILQTRLKRL